MIEGLKVGQEAQGSRKVSAGSNGAPCEASAAGVQKQDAVSPLHEMSSMPNCADLEPLAVGYSGVKRAADIVCSASLLFLLAPLFLFLALLVKCSSKGPVLYISQRVGLCGVMFPFFKFRTMEANADAKLAELMPENEKDGPIFKMAHDPRITAVGRFMRRTSLDELPQLFNVLRGEMSIVGPRPAIPREVILYTPEQLRRVQVKPGITCYWQVMGRSTLTFEEWMELDHKYLEEMSVLTDLRIFLLTPLAVLRGDGAF